MFFCRYSSSISRVSLVACRHAAGGLRDALGRSPVEVSERLAHISGENVAQVYRVTAVWHVKPV